MRKGGPLIRQFLTTFLSVSVVGGVVLALIIRADIRKSKDEGWVISETTAGIAVASSSNGSPLSSPESESDDPTVARAERGEISSSTVSRTSPGNQSNFRDPAAVDPTATELPDRSSHVLSIRHLLTSPTPSHGGVISDAVAQMEPTNNIQPSNPTEDPKTPIAVPISARTQPHSPYTPEQEWYRYWYGWAAFNTAQLDAQNSATKPSGK